MGWKGLAETKIVPIRYLSNKNETKAKQTNTEPWEDGPGRGAVFLVPTSTNVTIGGLELWLKSVLSPTVNVIERFFQSLAIFPAYSNIYVYNQELTQSGTSPFRPSSAEPSRQLAISPTLATIMGLGVIRQLNPY
jgi:hypothetical protein